MRIIALTDYKNRFGLKYSDVPYRSGMDKDLLKKCFNQSNVDIEFIQLTDIVNNKSLIDKDAFYIYTSSEDIRYYYKNFIEDVVLYLEEIGCCMIPKFKYLRANNNKVFMEFLRNSTNDNYALSIQSKAFGVMEEILPEFKNYQYPVVIKKSEGASGRGVFKADNQNELINVVKKISSTKELYYDFKDLLRTFKHKDYLKESKYRKKFIIQNMIPNLKNDWKVYFFYGKYYIFYRPVFKERGFRASGGGYENYFYDESAQRPEGIFDFAKEIVSNFSIPNASLDIAWDGKTFHLIEMQFLYFGTAGIPYSKGYYIEKNNKWIFVENKLSIEHVYSQSICEYINSIKK